MKEVVQSGRRAFVYMTFKLCENSSYLGTRIKAFLAANGFEVVEDEDDADVVVLVTCGFDQAREDKALADIERHVARGTEDRLIVVAGCLPRIQPRVEQMDGIVTISPKQMRKFDELFDARVPIATVRGNVIDKALLRHDGRHIGVGVNACGYPDDFHIQISQGCVNACSYCAIKKAKGSVTSKPPEDVLEEFRDGVSRGYGRFVLLADDCGSYGLDINTDLAELLNELDAEAETSLFDIHYIEPGRLVELHPRVARSAWRRLYFMNAPLQSTSSRILAAMNRHYDVEDVLSIVRQIKTIHPEIQLETHILYGFPGETRRDLEDTFRLAGDFDRVIYFCYTVRPNTRAARFRRGISETEKLRRARMIIEAARDRPHLKLGYSAQLIEGLMKDRGPRGA